MPTTQYEADSFIDNINYVANLDKRLGEELALSKSNIVFNGGTSYAAKAILKIYNLATYKTETVTTADLPIGIATIDAFLQEVKEYMESLYPITMSYTSGYSLGYAQITTSAVLNNNAYLLRDFEIDIMVGSDTKYAIGSTVSGSLELIPKLAMLTDEELASIVGVMELVPHLDELLLTDDNAAIAVQAALDAQASADKILNLSVATETLAFGEPITVEYDPAIGELTFGFPTIPLDPQWRAEEW